MKLKMLAPCVLVASLLGAAPAAANYDGAIWTTLGDGTEVNVNIYPS